MRKMKSYEVMRKQKRFQDYVGSYYAVDKNGDCAHFFNNELTQRTINSFIPDFIRWSGEEFYCNTEDREYLRDIMLVTFGFLETMDVEYPGAVEKWFYGSHVWAKWKLEEELRVKPVLV